MNRISRTTMCWMFLGFIMLQPVVLSKEVESQTTSPRIVALAPHLVEMMYAIGAEAHIVATVEYANHPTEAKAIPRIGDYRGISFERLLAHRPDVVLFWQGGNQHADLVKMKELGIEVISLPSRRLSDITNTLKVIGDITNKQPQAQAVADDFTNALRDVKTKYAQKDTVNVFYSLWHEPLMTISDDSWISDLLAHCQANNLFGNGATPSLQVSIEQVIQVKPEVIVVPDAHSDIKQDLSLWHKWPQIPAIENDAIVHVNGNAMHRFSPNLLSGLIKMCERIDQHR